MRKAKKPSFYNYSQKRGCDLKIKIDERWLFTSFQKEASEFEVLYLDPIPFFTAEMLSAFTGHTDENDV